MVKVRVLINNKDINVGAMSRALAVVVSGHSSVGGTTNDFLSKNGYYDFEFPTTEKADKFKGLVREYLSDKTKISD